MSADVVAYSALDWLTGILDDQTVYMGWGTGTEDAARTDTTLSSEATENRVAATPTRETISQTYDTIVWTATMTCNATPKTVTNIGVLSASMAGSLIRKANFTGIPVVEDDAIAFVVKWQFL